MISLKICVKYYCNSYICKISAKNYTTYGFLYGIDDNNSVLGTDAFYSVRHCARTAHLCSPPNAPYNKNQRRKAVEV